MIVGYGDHKIRPLKGKRVLMPSDVVPLDTNSLDIGEVTVPGRDELLRRLADCDPDQRRRDYLHPAIAHYLAGETFHPMGMLNALLVSATVYFDVTNPKASDQDFYANVAETTPDYLTALIDDNHIRHQMQCLWLWLAPQLGGSSCPT